MEQEEILSYNESFFKPSTLVFTTDKKELIEFEKTTPLLEPIIKGLLRSYEGIFDFPATIFETQLAGFLKKDVQLVRQELFQLNQSGIIDYSPQKDFPQITLLQNRMYADSFKINLEGYKQRKVTFEKRVKAITSYIKMNVSCRSQFIAKYFNDITEKRCSICDNCIAEKAKVLSPKEFDDITEHILNSLKNILNQLMTFYKNQQPFKKKNFGK